jgi:HD-like signal output (HDOD) protein
MRMDTMVLDLVKRSAAIPSMPQVATRFLEIIHDPEFEYRSAVEVISSDPGTASEILRLANSALFGVTRQVTSLSQAMTLLGIKRIRSLVLGRYIVDCINQKTPTDIDASYYWRRSLTTAVMSARLAEALGSEFCEEAFICGLLADIGVVILDDALHDSYRSIAEEYRPHGRADLATLERDQLGSTHADVSALVLEHWQLPDLVCDAVRNHPWDLREASGATLANVIGGADRIATRLCEAPTEMEAVLEDCRQVVEVLGLDPAVLAAKLEEIEAHIEEFAHVLRIEVSPSRVYELVAREIREQLIPQPEPSSA